MAREYALLGAYDISVQYYDRTLSSCTKYLRTLVDTQERNRWTKVRKE